MSPAGNSGFAPYGGRLLRAYGPLFASAVLFALMAALVPTVGREVHTAPVAGDQAEAARLEPTTPDQSAAGGVVTTAPPNWVAGPALPERAGSISGTAPPSGTETAPAGSVSAAQPDASRTPVAPVRPCPSRPRQVHGDPYSPPCLLFSGDNGGETTRGVTADRIRIAIRLFEIPQFAGGAEDGPMAALAFDKNRLKATILALVDYFNSRFQFYGRRLEPVFFDGKGDVMAEFQGAGQEGAEADGVKVADEIKPFAELLALTTPYADALSRRQVVNLGALFMSREWYEARRPYAWSTTPDCTFVLEAASDYLLKRVVRRPATHAGGEASRSMIAASRPVLLRK